MGKKQCLTSILCIDLSTLLRSPSFILQIPYPIIHTVERKPPSLQSGRHPLTIRCRDFLIVTLAMLKDGEAQDVFDSIQKLTCISK
jgi:hypothetical protein